MILTRGGLFRTPSINQLIWIYKYIIIIIIGFIIHLKITIYYYMLYHNNFVNLYSI